MSRGETEQSAKARSLNQDAARRIREIRSDERLSDHGKASAIARVFAGAKPQLQALREEEAAALADRRRHLEAKVFSGWLSTTGSPLDVIAFRDAQDRVANLQNPAEALELLARAEKTGDKGLANAIAQLAVERSWADVFQAWMGPRDWVRPYVEELAEIDEHLAATNVHHSMAFTLPVPPEIAHAAHNPRQLDLLAGEPAHA